MTARTTGSSTIAVDNAGRPRRRGRALHVGLWVAQLALAFLFAAAGFTKVTQPIADLHERMPWTADVPLALIRFIGAAELAAALGLLLPAATRIRPRLTPLAALGLVTLMLLAAGFHLARHERHVLPANFVLGAVAAFVAWGRLRKAPIAARESQA
jgi:uncharacterized membrane protein YphA (DoxX/SURF4 family)